MINLSGCRERQDAQRAERNPDDLADGIDYCRCGGVVF